MHLFTVKNENINPFLSFYFTNIIIFNFLSCKYLIVQCLIPLNSII